MKTIEMMNLRFIKELEESINSGCPIMPWQKMVSGLTGNYVSLKPYRGINALLLESGFYLTWKQITELQKKNPDIRVKKGSHTFPVVYWIIKRENDEDPTSPVTSMFPKYYTVFRACDVDNLPPKMVANTENPAEVFRTFMTGINHCQVETVMGSGDCYFSPSRNLVHLPPCEQFETMDEYYMAAAHELVHSTGVPLGRFEPNAPDTATMSKEEKYSFEELVATIGTHMVIQALGLTLEEAAIKNDVAYARHWLQCFKDDTSLLFKAASAAQKATDFLVPERTEITVA